MSGSFANIFREFQNEAGSLGIPLDREQIAQFQRYHDALREWNRVVRLVSTDDTESILWKHFMDSLSPYPLLADAKTLLDIGSGAGFPGIPLKIALPRLRLHLLESHRRKAHFLKHLVRLLGLRGVDVHHARVDPESALGPFEAVISRAVAAPRVWLPWAVNLLERDGQIILMLGPSVDMEHLHDLLTALGLQAHRTMDVSLPVLTHRRRVVAARKTGCFT